MASWTDAAKEEALDGVVADLVQLHDGDPGVNGDQNTISGKESFTFAAASAGVRGFSADVNFTSLTPNDAINFVTLWEDSSPDVLKVVLSRAAGEVVGDETVNAEGEATVRAATSIRLEDPD